MSEILNPGPIGIFDSGYGGLTVFREILDALPRYDYVYLGDNARTPYGTRSLEKVYEFTLEGVKYLFSKGCHMVVLACNTSSANALRRIQREDLPSIGDHKRVLGVIRPTAERLSQLSDNGHIGICATEATVNSQSYVIEAAEYAPEVTIHQQACPMWVPIIENDEQDSLPARYFSEKYIELLLRQHQDIDSILLACTHYPILKNTISKYVPTGVNLLTQGEIVAESLKDYMKRHPWMDELCSKEGKQIFLTTDSANDFNTRATKYFGSPVLAQQVSITEK
ncbi:MAG: glutamate racemase [Flavobacteriales bacterium]|nr:glutamate racemase [Flavobacteriales bacterium]